MSRHTVPLAGTTLILAALLSGCSDGGAPIAGQVSLNMATRAGTAAAIAAGTAFSVTAAPETYTDANGSTLVISRVQLVLREIELERTDAPINCDPTLPDDDDCDEDLEFGPRLVDLPLGTAGAMRSFSVPVEAGEFQELEFEVHRVDGGNTEDAAFIAANPTFDGVSIRVTGTYNGTGFTYDSDLNVEFELALVPPLTVTETSGTDVTLFVDLANWFRGQSGLLMDPQTANAGGANESLVEGNIVNSLEAFEDDDRDGRSD